MKLTFSKPKNLSLPSSRRGPAFCNIFSSGVISGTGSSFFLAARSFATGVAEFYRDVLSARQRRWARVINARCREEELAITKQHLWGGGGCKANAPRDVPSRS